MSNIVEKIVEVRNIRDDIRSAIVDKDGVLPVGSPMSAYPESINALGGAIIFPNGFLYLLKEGDPDLYPYSSSSFRYRGTQTKVYLDDSISDVRRMFGNTMVDCVFLPNGHTVTNMTHMFRDSPVTTLDLSNFDTSGVTTMSYMFSGSQATTLDLSNFDTSGTTTMSYMFSGSQATTLDLSSFDTSGVTSMSNMFSGSQATILDLSNFDTSGVTTMSTMFRNAMVKIVYCRTEADRTKFMSSTNLPDGINFIVGAP